MINIYLACMLALNNVAVVNNSTANMANCEYVQPDLQKPSIIAIFKFQFTQLLAF